MLSKIIKRHRLFLFAIVISFLTYLIFYGAFLTPSHYFWSSATQTTDAQTEYVPARVYFYNKIVKEHAFPFWTEKMYSGFPIFADLENSYLNPVNDLSILIFGPWTSYKVLHLLEYLLGSLSLYFLLKRKGIGLLGFSVANVIFYFNTFSINHQIHFNVIMALFLIPTALLLADLFLEKRQWCYIFLESLVISNAVLWGHMQSAVIVGMGVFFYLFVFSFKKIRFSVFFLYFIALFLFVAIETLPQVVPTYELYSQGLRSSNLDYLKGSLSPKMIILSFVPYLFGSSEDFVGQKINDGFMYSEIYTYIGISAMLLSFLALLFLKKSREVILGFVFIWIFLIFAFLSHNKIFPDNTPLLTFFREWERTAALSSFGVAILVAIMIEKINEVSWKKFWLGFLMITSPFVYIWSMIITDSGGSRRVNMYTSFNYIQNYYPYYPILKIIVLTLIGVLVLFFIIRKFYPPISVRILLLVKIILVGIVFFDLIYFSQDVLAFRLRDISGYKIFSAPTELTKKRAILESLPIVGMESLYYSNWSPLGVSQLKEKSYVNYYAEMGIRLTGMPSSASSISNDYQKLREAGIVAVTNASGITYLNNQKLDLIKNDLEGNYLEKKEGHIIMSISNPSDTIINTYLRYSPYWKVTIDGQETTITQNDIFFDFPLNQGKHVVEIYYFPKSFYVTLASCLLLGSIIGLFFYNKRKKIKTWNILK